jgi:hypothetical protein
MTDSEQLAGLATLQSIIGTYEVNTMMVRAPGDVAFVAAADVPDASQICYASGEGYDVWRWRNGARRLAETNLSVSDAANIVIMEYLTEKVRRAKRLNPNLRGYSDKVLLAHLLKGYQGSQSAAMS